MRTGGLAGAGGSVCAWTWPLQATSAAHSDRLTRRGRARWLNIEAVQSESERAKRIMVLRVPCRERWINNGVREARRLP